MKTTMTRSGLAIAVTTLGTVLLATTAFAKVNLAASAPKAAVTKFGTATKGTGTAHVPPVWSKLPPGALNNNWLKNVNKPGTGGGSVVSCSQGTGCTTGKHPGHGGGHYGSGHYGSGHYWSHYAYKQYGWRWWYRYWPVVFTAVDYVDGCAFEYKPRIRFVPGLGLRRVFEKVCIAEI